MNRNSNFIPFALPSIGREEEKSVISVLRSGWLTTGKITSLFESEFAGYLGVKHALGVNSATAGLHLALDAIGIKKGDEILTTPYTFAATAEIIKYFGAKPVFVDIDKNTFNIDPGLIPGKLNKNTRAIIPVHIAGLPCDMKAIDMLSKKYGIKIIEDAAHAFPAKTMDGRAGTIGDIGVFSFYATKTITTGEGGMVVTNNDDYAERISTMRLHGIDRKVWDRHRGKTLSWEYEVVEAGYKYNLTDIASSIGRCQLKKADAFLARRKYIAEKYIEKFNKYDFLILPPRSDNHSWHLFILRINEKKLTISRNSFMKELEKKGIGTSVHYKPLHIMPYYKKTLKHEPEDFPESIKVFKSAISLPIYPGLNNSQINRIISAVLDTGLSNYNGKIHAG